MFTICLQYVCMCLHDSSNMFTSLLHPNAMPWRLGHFYLFLIRLKSLRAIPTEPTRPPLLALDRKSVATPAPDPQKSTSAHPVAIPWKFRKEWKSRGFKRTNTWETHSTAIHYKHCQFIPNQHCWALWLPRRCFSAAKDTTWIWLTRDKKILKRIELFNRRNRQKMTKNDKDKISHKTISIDFDRFCLSQELTEWGCSGSPQNATVGMPFRLSLKLRTTSRKSNWFSRWHNFVTNINLVIFGHFRSPPQWPEGSQQQQSGRVGHVPFVQL